ncbi:MAG: ribbon-helix-helix protein, CopG family [Dehalococcoidia bacterium]
MSKRLTVTLPDELAAELREEAARTGDPVSRLVARAIADRKRQRLRELMAEGYRAWADEDERLAEEAIPVALETWPDD